MARLLDESVPAPFGGWNTRDAKSAMQKIDAVTLDNWFPGLGEVSIRKGYSSHSTSLGSGSASVDTVIEYHSGSTRHLIAACDGKIYNSTAAAAATQIGSGFTNDRWQGVNFSAILVLVNGEDTPQQWNGTTLSAMTWTGSGLTSSDLIGVEAGKNRLFFWEDDSQDFWYADVDVITGTLTKFPLSRLGKFGGKLVSMATWSADAGDGPDDRFAFLMSSGQLAVYEGTDPGDATKWALIGIYDIGEPAGIRGMVKIGGDLKIITSLDYVSLGQVFADPEGGVGLSTKASGALQAAYKANNALFGWQAVLFSDGPFILFNVPLTSTTFEQHIVNIKNGSWCRFKNINAYAWGTYSKDLYFGGLGVVYKAWTGNNDDGSAITADATTAWSSFGSSRRKRLAAYKPVIETNGDLDYESDVGFDYRAIRTLDPSTIESSGTAWGSAWGSPWSEETGVNDYYTTGQGYGVAAAIRLKISAKKEVSWLRTDYLAELGRNY